MLKRQKIKFITSRDAYNGRTPLINAAFGSSLAFVRENLDLLIKAGADINAVDMNGANALMKTDQISLLNSTYLRTSLVGR